MTDSETQTDQRRHRQWRGFAAIAVACLPLSALGCWATHPRVAAPDFTSVRVRQEALATVQRAATQAAASEQLRKTDALVSLSPTPKSGGAADSGAWQPAVSARTWRFIVLHHSATEGGSVESIDAVHRQRLDARGNPWLGIGYHFVVGNGGEMPDGEIVPTFRWNQQLAGAHAGDRDHNAQGIGVCAIGDFDAEPPTPLQVASLRRLISTLAQRYKIPPSAVIAHSSLKATNCPGQFFPLDELAAAADVSATDAASAAGAGQRRAL